MKHLATKNLVLVTLALTFILCSVPHYASAQESSAPSVMYQDLLDAIDKVNGNLLLFITEGYWMTDVDGYKVTWQIPPSEVTTVSFGYDGGALQFATVDFDPEIVVYLPDNTVNGKPIPISIKRIKYNRFGIPTEPAVATGPRFRKHLELTTNKPFNLDNISKTPQGFFIGNPFKSSTTAVYLGSNPAPNPTVPKRSMIERVLVRTLSSTEPGFQVTLKSAKRIRFGKPRPGTQTFDNEMTLKNSSDPERPNGFLFSEIDYNVLTKDLNGNLDNLTLEAEKGTITGEDLTFILQRGTRFFLRDVAFNSASPGNASITVDNGEVKGAVGAGSNLSIGEQADFTLKDGTGITINAIRFTITGARLNRVEMGDATVDMRVGIGQLNFGDIGALTIANGSLSVSALRGTWEQGKSPQNVYGEIRNLNVPITTGRFAVNSESILQVRSGSIQTTVRPLIIDSTKRPLITGPLGEFRIVAAGGSVFKAGGAVSFFPREGGELSAVDPARPLTITVGGKYPTGRFELNTRFTSLEISSNVQALLDGGADGNINIIVTNDGDGTARAERIAFNGELREIRFPVEPRGHFQGRADRMEGLFTADFKVGQKARLAGDFQLSNTTIASARMELNAGSLLAISGGTIRRAELSLNSEKPRPLTGTFRNMALTLSQDSAFSIPGSLFFKARNGGSLSANDELRPFRIIDGRDHPVGHFTMSLPFEYAAPDNQHGSLENGTVSMDLIIEQNGQWAGSNLDLNGAFGVEMASGRSLGGSLEIKGGTFNVTPGAATTVRLPLTSATIQPGLIASLKTDPDKNKDRWIFPVSFNLSLIEPLKIPSTIITIDGSNISMTEIDLNIALGVYLPKGGGEYVNPRLRDGNFEYDGFKTDDDDYRDKQEVFRDEFSGAGGIGSCTPHLYLHEGLYALRANPLKMRIVNSEVFVRLPANSLSVSVPNFNTDGCEGYSGLLGAITGTIIGFATGNPFLGIIAGAVVADKAPDFIVGVIISQLIARAINSREFNFSFRLKRTSTLFAKAGRQNRLRQKSFPLRTDLSSRTVPSTQK